MKILGSCLGAALLATSFLLAADTDEAVQKELKALQGKWKTVGGEAGGKAFPKDSVPAFTFSVGADGKCTGKTPQEEMIFTMTVNPKKNPKTLENAHEAGSQKGKKQYGIYKLEGDTFTVCITGPGAAETDRPKDFTTKDTGYVVFVFERVKDK
jgi:uncharacterized protein (TIGR03067 family)